MKPLGTQGTITIVKGEFVSGILVTSDFPKVLTLEFLSIANL